MDYEWLYERLDPYYCHDNGRPGTDPVVLIKMVLLQHLFGIPSLRQTYQRIQDTNSYRWFLGYGLLDDIPHFATVSYAFCKRFPDELTSEIFEHILNKALNNKILDPNAIFIDGTHIKASANKKKFQKEQVAKAAKVYSGQLRREVNEENVVRMKKGKRYTPHISGRSIWIWLNRYAKRNVRRRFMRSAKKPLNGSLQTRKRNTRCVIHTTEAWPPSHDGSG